MIRRHVIMTVALAAVALVSPLWGSPAAVGDPLIPKLFLVFAVMLVVGKVSGEFFERIGQPAVLGELIAGVLLGGSVLGVIPTSPENPMTEIITILAEIGVVVLLFEIGLETDLKQMFKVGRGAAAVAFVGVTVPMATGILFWLSPLIPSQYSYADTMTSAIFLGATLTATSVGITARVLTDLRVMGSVEARLIIGAAVIDDVIGLILLGIVATLVAGAEPSVLDITKNIGAAIGFLVLAVVVGLAIMPKIFQVIDKMRVRGMLLVSAFAFLLALAALADLAGSAMIIGAFAAGLVLSGTNQFDVINERIKPVADVFTPVFFLSIGAQFDVRLLNPFVEGNRTVLLIGFALFIIAVFGKLVAGWAAPWRKFNRPAVGIGMLPRGEVGLIFANIGLVAGVLTSELFSAIILMVIGTTFIAPPLLKWAFAKWGVTRPQEPLPQRLSQHHRSLDGIPEPNSIVSDRTKGTEETGGTEGTGNQKGTVSG